MGFRKGKKFIANRESIVIKSKTSIFIHEYKVQSKIGEGSFSEVLKCQDRQSGTIFAAKQLKKTFRSEVHADELPELVAMRKLTQHPNILHMIESHFDPVSGKMTFIFELMEMSLYDMLKNRKRCIPEARAKNYLYQIVKGVDHIHQHGIFHRDIKPENILVKGDSLKISDLGSIKGIFSKQPYTEYISTRWYRSPECLLTNGFYGPKMDVWAIGCVFFELLTLKPLFPGSNELDQIARINNILGTPSSRLLNRFRKYKCRNDEFKFATKQGTGLNPLIPLISESGRDVMKQMIVYDPDGRTNIRRLMEHKYFNDLREAEYLTRKLSESSSSCLQVGQKSWRNPMLLSYLTSEKRHRAKRKLPEKKKYGEKTLRANATIVTTTTSTVKSKELKQEETTAAKMAAKHNLELNHCQPSSNTTSTASVIANNIHKHKVLMGEARPKPKGTNTLKSKLSKRENEGETCRGERLEKVSTVENLITSRKLAYQEAAARSYMATTLREKDSRTARDAELVGRRTALLAAVEKSSSIAGRLPAARRPFVLGYKNTTGTSLAAQRGGRQ